MKAAKGRQPFRRVARRPQTFMQFDLGCAFFDTAERYGGGENERLVGRALAPIRDQVVIATKFRVGDSASGAEVGRQIRARLEASLTRLGTEYVELYYQHRVSPSVPVEDVAAVMGELIAEGKVGGWGQSPATVEQIRRCTRGHSDHRDPERVLDHGADVRGRRHPSV
jgi:aryl-alcohol dehydrogenase-like predicted oxidoreductase